MCVCVSPRPRALGYRSLHPLLGVPSLWLVVVVMCTCMCVAHADKERKRECVFMLYYIPCRAIMLSPFYIFACYFIYVNVRT